MAADPKIKKKKKLRRLSLSIVWRTFSPFIKDILEHVEGNNCVTCGKKDLIGVDRQLGHFRPKKAYPNVRWWIHNLGIQCAKCNLFYQGKPIEYIEYIKNRRGRLVAEEVLLYSNKSTHSVGQYEYREMLNKIQVYKNRLKTNKMSHQDIYKDIIDTRFGLFIN